MIFLRHLVTIVTNYHKY